MPFPGLTRGVGGASRFGRRPPNLHLYQNSSNLRVVFLYPDQDLGGKLAQFCGDGAAISAYLQNMPLESDDPAGAEQRRRRSLAEQRIQGGKLVSLARERAQRLIAGEERIQTL